MKRFLKKQNPKHLSRLTYLCVSYIPLYEGPAKKSFVTGFELLQYYVLSNIFLLQIFKVFRPPPPPPPPPPLLKHIFVTFLPSREKQINSLLLVSVDDTDKKRCQENF